MATKKKTVTHTPKKRKTSLTKSAKSAKKKRKSHPKKTNMLSEMVTPERAQQSGKAVLSGAVGGAVVHVIEKAIPATWGIGARLLTIGLASFATATVFNMPNMSAGMAGAGGYIAVDKKLLADDADDAFTTFGVFAATFAADLFNVGYSDAAAAAFAGGGDGGFAGFGADDFAGGG